MEDFSRRLDKVETDVSDLKSAVASIAATIPHLSTKADVATMESTIIKWMIATVLTATTVSTTVAFTIAKLVH